jgi:hypothetical protein
MQTRRVFIAALAAATVVCGLRVYRHQHERKPALQKARSAYNRLPLAFEANTGQAPQAVKFRARGQGYSLLLTDAGAALSLKKHVHEAEPRRDTTEPRAQNSAALQMILLGAKAADSVEGVDQLPGRTNYFIGRDPARWRTNIANYAKVKYQDVYPGVDLVYYGNQGQLEFDFVVTPHADPNAIGLRFDGARGTRVERATGELVVDTGSGDLRLHKPVIYQRRVAQPASFFDAPNRLVDGRFVLKGRDRVAFEIGSYDPSQALVIDPTLVFSTYLGGTVPTGTMANTNDESYGGIAVDSSGNAYVTGDTDCYDFPVAGNAFQPTHAVINGDSDAFVTKFSADGSTLIYSTFLGGGDEDYAFAIAVDSSGSAYVAGGTNSTDFPTLNPVQAAFAGGPEDGFVTKLSPDGSSLIYSTYLGGSSDDQAYVVTPDENGNAYIGGSTQSTNYPVLNALQPNNKGGWDGFITKLSSAGAMVWSTYLGGSLDDYMGGIAIDPKGGLAITGSTASLDFPLVNALQPVYGGGSSDAFVAKLNTAGSKLTYSTYLGGSDLDSAFFVAADPQGHIYVTGWTTSTNFPTKNPLQPVFGGGPHDLFITKLNAAGSALVYSTYLGGSGDDNPWGMAVDSSDRVWVAGFTNSTNYPVTGDALQNTLAGGYDGFVTQLNATGTKVRFSTYFGGSGDDNLGSLALDSNGGVYITGSTVSTDFPLKNPYQPVFKGLSDAFIAKIQP